MTGWRLGYAAGLNRLLPMQSDYKGMLIGGSYFTICCGRRFKDCSLKAMQEEFKNAKKLLSKV